MDINDSWFFLHRQLVELNFLSPTPLQNSVLGDLLTGRINRDTRWWQCQRFCLVRGIF